ncbi:hypothetical protein FISHEDRAFT_65800 [Fistulina hepatica ATCC 64428]|uniref:Uncharacterized protein n=1 Tax=Fistulina hepatica ATCC 64428 TaxID=1128425 RepID=A0A0D7AC60_9AGAR|nr:hypothetical protein FISHEDRAFT_65800 [Fistulina hepatica ATCC 64428]
MRQELICSTPSWFGTGPHRDCVFVSNGVDADGFRGLKAVCIMLFFSFNYQGTLYPCALVQWFSATNDAPDPDTGMWTIKADIDDEGERDVSVIHVDSILRAAHLLPIFGQDFLPKHFHFTHTYDAFDMFFVNKYADHHANTIAW